jgi:hypothetical protein
LSIATPNAAVCAIVNVSPAKRILFIDISLRLGSALVKKAAEASLSEFDFEGSRNQCDESTYKGGVEEGLGFDIASSRTHFLVFDDDVLSRLKG